MATATLLPDAPADIHPTLMRRFTVAEYHKMIEVGVLRSGEPYELLHGWIVHKLPNHPPHASTVRRVGRRLDKLLGDAFVVRSQLPITIADTDSEPEPDLVVAVGPEDRYNAVHPVPREILLAGEVAASSLPRDLGTKLTAYAAAKIPQYWVINLDAHRVEVYSEPRGGKNPTYRTRRDYGPGDTVPVVLAGRIVGSIPVNELLP